MGAGTVIRHAYYAFFILLLSFAFFFVPFVLFYHEVPTRLLGHP